MPKVSGKNLLKAYIRANVGRVLTSDELREASGNQTEWARRVRELREDEGWPILTNNDSSKLKPGEYLLEKEPPADGTVTFSRKMSARLKAQVLDRNGFTCQMCGLSPGDIDPDTNRKVRLHIGHIDDKSLGGKELLSNLRTLCSSCNQGAKNVTAEKPKINWLLIQVRRAGHAEQKEVFDWLKKRLGE